MIVDCHAHIWETIGQLGQCAEPWRLRVYSSAARAASGYDLQLAGKPVEVSFVLGFRSKALGVDIPNKFIADYAFQYKDRVLGFGSIDPAHDVVSSEADRIRQEYRLAGFVISPGAQGFHPTSTRVLSLYEYAAEHRMPVIVHHGPPFGLPFCEFANPVLMAAVCRDFATVKFVLTDMGWPWVDEALLLAAEYENVYVDLAGVAGRDLVAYDCLAKAHQLGVLEKLLLASDFPAAGAAAAIEAIFSINQLASSTNLPTIPRQKLREIVERDTLKVLGVDDRLAAKAAAQGEG